MRKRVLLRRIDAFDRVDTITRSSMPTVAGAAEVKLLKAQADPAGVDFRAWQEPKTKGTKPVPTCLVESHAF